MTLYLGAFDELLSLRFVLTSRYVLSTFLIILLILLIIYTRTSVCLCVCVNVVELWISIAYALDKFYIRVKSYNVTL